MKGELGSEVPVSTEKGFGLVHLQEIITEPMRMVALEQAKKALAQHSNGSRVAALNGVWTKKNLEEITSLLEEMGNLPTGDRGGWFCAGPDVRLAAYMNPQKIHKDVPYKPNPRHGYIGPGTGDPESWPLLSSKLMMMSSATKVFDKWLVACAEYVIIPGLVNDQDIYDYAINGVERMGDSKNNLQTLKFMTDKLRGVVYLGNEVKAGHIKFISEENHFNKMMGADNFVICFDNPNSISEIKSGFLDTFSNIVEFLWQAKLFPSVAAAQKHINLWERKLPGFSSMSTILEVRMDIKALAPGTRPGAAQTLAKKIEAMVNQKSLEKLIPDNTMKKIMGRQVNCKNINIDQALLVNV